MAIKERSGIAVGLNKGHVRLIRSYFYTLPIQISPTLMETGEGEGWGVLHKTENQLANAIH